MGSTRVEARRATTRTRLVALGAAGIVLAGGAAVGSLAAWTDIEWIAGGVDTVAGVTASSFEVEQNASTGSTWTHHETQGAANVIDFSEAAASLTPGDTVYGFVRLRTPVGSLGGELSLVAESDVSVVGSLDAALTAHIVLLDDPADCTAADMTAAATATLVAAGSGLDTDGAASFELDAATSTLAGTEQTLCIALNFPGSFAGDDSLQGAVANPVWSLDALSVTP